MSKHISEREIEGEKKTYQRLETCLHLKPLSLLLGATVVVVVVACIVMVVVVFICMHCPVKKVSRVKNKRQKQKKNLPGA